MRVYRSSNCPRFSWLQYRGDKDTLPSSSRLQPTLHILNRPSRRINRRGNLAHLFSAQIATFDA